MRQQRLKQLASLAIFPISQTSYSGADVPPRCEVGPHFSTRNITATQTRQVARMIERLGDPSETVLLTDGNGTGKEIVANGGKVF